MKMIIKNKEYAVCDKCQSFISSPRCYSCYPLQQGDLDCCEQLREYYNIPPKPFNDKLIKHHLLQYYFTRKTLIEMGLYYNVPEWQLLQVKISNHNRTIGTMKLHEHKLESCKELYMNMSDEFILNLIDKIPQELIESFKAE